MHRYGCPRDPDTAADPKANAHRVHASPWQYSHRQRGLVYMRRWWW